MTINGTTGDVMVGKVPTVAPTMTGDFATLMTWADKSRKLKIRTNADTPADAAKAREFGAEGIGLCRTEHMFFGEDRIIAMREMILASDEAGREAALAKIEPYQKADFVGIFEAMDGFPVTIRLLDPPLHEFLPHDARGQEEVARSLGVTVAKIKERVDELHEFNPMMGFRGCRLPVVFPEIGDMQVRAIIEAAIEVKKKGKSVLPEIMIPLVGMVEELTMLKKRAIQIAEECMKKAGSKVEYQIGTMIELPRAALIADKIAEEAEFFSFGTNDLTQMTFGFSRDDIKGFMPTYLKEKILPVDPFQSIDVGGVGQLIEIGVKKRPREPQGEAQPAPEGRHLRRTRRRPGQRCLLPQGRHGLRQLLAVPRADRTSRRRPGRARRNPARQVSSRRLSKAHPDSGWAFLLCSTRRSNKLAGGALFVGYSVTDSLPNSRGPRHVLLLRQGRCRRGHQHLRPGVEGRPPVHRLQHAVQVGR